MPKFRKKPVVIEAEQLTREKIEAHFFEDAPLPRGVMRGNARYHKTERKLWDYYLYVRTIHGPTARIVEDDWIMPEPDGEHFYPCKPDIFEATYEQLAD